MSDTTPMKVKITKSHPTFTTSSGMNPASPKLIVTVGIASETSGGK